MKSWKLTGKRGEPTFYKDDGRAYVAAEGPALPVGGHTRVVAVWDVLRLLDEQGQVAAVRELSRLV